MTATLQYLRPTTLEEALRLLRRPGMRTVPMAGGAWLIPRLRRDVAVPDPLDAPVEAVVDLAGLGLDGIETEGEPGDGWLRLGAAATLTAISESAICRAIAGGILAEAAQRATPLNQRNQVTLAGALLGDMSWELTLALLALAAHAVFETGQTILLALPDLLADTSRHLDGGLVTEVKLPWPTDAARGSLARVARTPADQPIVAAAAVVEGGQRRVAIGGVAEKPVVLRLADGNLEQALEEALAGAPLRSDWLGSAEYRREMAVLLGRRALAAAGS